MPRIILEIAIDTLDAGLQSLDAGADRLEVCSRLDLGGLTPPTHLVRSLRKATLLPLFIMIRPRPGNFVYASSEAETIREQIVEHRDAGADGFVFGMLRPNGCVDVESTNSLVQKAMPLPVTFHRACDETPELMTAAQEILSAGVVRLLTSGGRASAWEGRDVIRRLIQAYEPQLTIMPGGGVRPSNVEALVRFTNVREVHSAARDEAGIFDAGIVREIRSILDANLLSQVK